MDCTIEGASATAAILVMPGGERFQISRRRDDERDSGIELSGHMQWQDWIVRGRDAPGALSPYA